MRSLHHVPFPAVAEPIGGVGRAARRVGVTSVSRFRRAFGDGNSDDSARASVHIIAIGAGGAWYDGIAAMTGFGLMAAAAVMVPAILVAVVPRRWMGRAMFGWVVSPVIAYIGVLGWEAMTRTGVEHGFANALLGFSLISAIFVLPWAIACAMGFAIGLGLRRLFRGAATPAAAPAPEPVAVAPPIVFAVPAVKVSSDATAWREAHIGFSDDGLAIGGLDVWTHEWRRVDTPPLSLCHPAHPQQMHQFTVYEIEEGASVARFAVSELSNGVWGFYVPKGDPVETRGSSADRSPDPNHRHISPDGTIRIDIAAVEWGNSHWVNTPRVIDIASGRVILDLWGTDWDAGISWPGNRRVALDFRRYHFSGDLTIELDLAQDRYAITREPGGIAPLPSGPLAEAADAMEASGRRTAAFAAQGNAGRPVWDADTKPGPWAAWRTALLILLVAAVLIAIAAAIAIRSEPEPRPGLIREIPRPRLSAPERGEPGGRQTSHYSGEGALPSGISFGARAGTRQPEAGGGGEMGCSRRA